MFDKVYYLAHAFANSETQVWEGMPNAGTMPKNPWTEVVTGRDQTRVLLAIAAAR